MEGSFGRGRSVLKKGRDGRNSCHSVTENCYPGLSQSPIQNPNQKISLRFCLCLSHVTYDSLFTVLSQLSVSVTRSLSFGLKSESPASSLCRTTLSSLRILVFLQFYHGSWLAPRKFWFKFWKLEIWKFGNTTPSPIFIFFCIGLCFKGGRGVRA